MASSKLKLDRETESLLQKLRDACARKKSSFIFVSNYIKLVVNLREAPIPKLRLFSHLLQSPHTLLNQQTSGSVAGQRDIDELTRAYRHLFARWWKSFVAEIEQEYPELDERLERIKELRSTYPKIMLLSGVLAADFRLSIDTLLHQTDSAITLRRASGKQKVNHSEEKSHSGSSSKKNDALLATAPIPWAGPNVVLVYTFELYKKYGWISPEIFERRFELIRTHFVDRSGNRFDDESLRQSERNYKKNNGLRSNKRPKGGHLIEADLERWIEENQE